MGVVEMRRRRLRRDHGRRARGIGCGRSAIEVDALMGAIPAGGVAKLAADAQVLVNTGHDLVIQVELVPVGYRVQRAAAEVVDGGEAFLRHPGQQAILHIFDDAVAVMHGRGAYLHRAATQQDEFRCVSPAADAADAGERQCTLRVRQHLAAPC